LSNLIDGSWRPNGDPVQRRCFAIAGSRPGDGTFRLNDWTV
jgi:hypothetical protein